MSFLKRNDRVSDEVAINTEALVEGIDAESTLTQVTMKTNATVGTIAWECIPRNATEWEPLQLNGADYVSDLTSAVRTFSIVDFAIHSLRGTPSGQDGDAWSFVTSNRTK